MHAKLKILRPNSLCRGDTALQNHMNSFEQQSRCLRGARLGPHHGTTHSWSPPADKYLGRPRKHSDGEVSQKIGNGFSLNLLGWQLHSRRSHISHQLQSFPPDLDLILPKRWSLEYSAMVAVEINKWEENNIGRRIRAMSFNDLVRRWLDLRTFNRGVHAHAYRRIPHFTQQRSWKSSK